MLSLSEGRVEGQRGDRETAWRRERQRIRHAETYRERERGREHEIRDRGRDKDRQTWTNRQTWTEQDGVLCRFRAPIWPIGLGSDVERKQKAHLCCPDTSQFCCPLSRWGQALAGGS